MELPPEGIVGSEVGSAEGLVRDFGSRVFTTIFSLPSFVCVFVSFFFLFYYLEVQNLLTLSEHRIHKIFSSVHLTSTCYASDTHYTP